MKVSEMTAERNRERGRSLWDRATESVLELLDGEHLLLRLHLEGRMQHATPSGESQHQQVRQLGNAVTPPAAALLLGRCLPLLDTAAAEDAAPIPGSAR
jgi:hypothetical protein